MNVLHDWDNPYRSGRWCIRRGVQLIIYALSKRIKILRKMSMVKEMYTELYNNAITLAKLDRLVKVHGIFGVKDSVVHEFPTIEEDINSLKLEYRRHIHVDYPRAVRWWEPPLSQREVTWRYDQKYRDHGRNIPIKLKPGELPIFHVDYPNFIPLYIDWLYWVLEEGGEIYE